MERDLEPLSPRGQYLSSPVLSIVILGIFEFEIPIESSHSHIMDLMEKELLPINQRFSSIMVEDENGAQRWKRVEVKIEEHLILPVFPNDLSKEGNGEYLQDYLSKIGMEPLPKNRPMWEIHIIKYPTTSSSGTVVFKLHHALGDGYSLMAALFSSVKRQDDPSLPLTLPSFQSKNGLLGGEMSIWQRVSASLSVLWYTTTDIISSLVEGNWVEDVHTPIRSQTDELGFSPITISSIVFSLDHIKQVKAKLGGTVNDVICGTIFYGIRLYMQEKASNKAVGDAHATTMVLFNTRMIGCNYKSLEEMATAGTNSPWGNHYGFFFVPLPHCGDTEKADPLEFIWKTKQMIDQKKRSLVPYLNAAVLELVRIIRGSQVATKFLQRTIRNNSISISSLVGPIEKVVMGGYPVKSFYFMTCGVPQSLNITVASYMQSLRVGVGAEKGFIDSQLFISCLEKAFARIFEAAVIKGKTYNSTK